MNEQLQKAKRDWWTISLLHAALALLMPLFLFWMVGCKGPSQGPEDVDYGPAVSSTDVNTALSGMIRGSDPTQVQPGAYVHFSTSEDVSAGEMSIIMADTFQQITARSETPDVVTLDVIETKATYHQADATTESITRGFQMNFAKASAQALAEPNLGALLTAAITPSSLTHPNDAAEPTPTPAPDPATTKVTFHHLKTWEDVVAAPAAVLARPNCLGLPNCSLTERHVTFDMVVWSSPEGDPMHFAFATSPQIPQTIGYQMSPIQNFIPGLMKSCLTQMVPVTSGTQTTKTLISECQQVEDFLFSAQ